VDNAGTAACRTGLTNMQVSQCSADELPFVGRASDVPVIPHPLISVFRSSLLAAISWRMIARNDLTRS
jgi:hypothetical protein